MEVVVTDKGISEKKTCHLCRYYLEEKAFCAYYGIRSKPMHVCEKWKKTTLG